MMLLLADVTVVGCSTEARQWSDSLLACPKRCCQIHARHLLRQFSICTVILINNFPLIRLFSWLLTILDDHYSGVFVN
jgi:hypothetical protein